MSSLCLHEISHDSCSHNFISRKLLFEKSEFILEDCLADSSKAGINLLYIVLFSAFSKGACAAFCCVSASQVAGQAVPCVQEAVCKPGQGPVSGSALRVGVKHMAM